MPFGPRVLQIPGRNGSALQTWKKHSTDTGPGEAKPEMQGDFRQQPQKEAAGEVIGIHCHQMTHGWSSNNCMMPFPASSASLSDSVPPGTR